MLALTQCWFTRTHIPSHAGKRDGEGVWRSECRHCDRPIISWDRKAWHLAEGFNLMQVYQGVEKPFLYLIDTRNDFVVARFPIDHLTTEDEIEAFAEQVRADNNVDDPDSALALRDSRKQTSSTGRKPARKAAAKAAPAVEPAQTPPPATDPATQAANDEPAVIPPQAPGMAIVGQPAAVAVEPPRDADRLTGLPGRTTFETVFEMACRQARETQGQLTIAFADIDRLDRLNRAQGLDAGDGLIRFAADQLGLIAGAQRHLSRNRGLEFVLLLPSSATDAAATLEQVRSAIATCPDFHNDGQAPGISCGLAAIPLEGDPRLALRAADVALHRAKAQGGNGVIIGTIEP